MILAILTAPARVRNSANVQMHGSFDSRSRLLALPQDDEGFTFLFAENGSSGLEQRHRLLPKKELWETKVLALVILSAVGAYATTKSKDLCVVCQEVVPIKTGAADRNSVVKTSMRPVPVVLVDPGGKFGGA